MVKIERLFVRICIELEKAVRKIHVLVVKHWYKSDQSIFHLNGLYHKLHIGHLVYYS